MEGQFRSTVDVVTEPQQRWINICVNGKAGSAGQECGGLQCWESSLSLTHEQVENEIVQFIIHNSNFWTKMN